MLSKKKKTIIITTIVVAVFAIMGIVYALTSGGLEFFGKIKTGSVEIETLNLTLKKANGQDVTVVEPADINTLAWTTKNIGTSGILTRHTVELYWNDVDEATASTLLYVYPANMSKEAILEDYKNGSLSECMIKTTPVSKKENGKTKYGIKFQFLGDTLDGTDIKNVSKEVNYNITTENLIDSSINTDDADDMMDTIAFRLLISPETSYLYQNKSVSVKVVTEAMQYTKDGNQNWKVVDTTTIN